ncbi:MAG: putative signal peptidase [Naasia sp.]|nr:putative signal peptidase [Naasia sp.]
MREVLSAVLKGVWRGVGVAVVLAMLALAALVLVIPVAGGATPLTVLTGSMEPTLPPGTLIVVKRTPAAAIQLGDVVTYQIKPDEPAVVTHRVVEVRSLSNGTFQFVTMGDANDAPDLNPVVEGQVKGVVWYSVPLVGWVTTGLIGQHRAWLLPLVGVGLLAIAAGSLISTVRDSRRKRARAAGEPAAVETPEIDRPAPAGHAPAEAATDPLADPAHA